MSRCFRYVPVLVLFVLSAVGGPAPGADDEVKPVKPSKTWDGEVKIELRKDAPATGFVADKESWEKLWKAYQPGEKVPAVDFDSELVLVAVNKDPNRISIAAALNDKGDLTVTSASTKIGFPNPQTCRYEFAVVNREDIKTVNGKPLAGK